VRPSLYTRTGCAQLFLYSLLYATLLARASAKALCSAAARSSAHCPDCGANPCAGQTFTQAYGAAAALPKRRARAAELVFTLATSSYACSAVQCAARGRGGGGARACTIRAPSKGQKREVCGGLVAVLLGSRTVFYTQAGVISTRHHLTGVGAARRARCTAHCSCLTTIPTHESTSTVPRSVQF
jgi:hypothetical protein